MRSLPRHRPLSGSPIDDRGQAYSPLLGGQVITLVMVEGSPGIGGLPIGVLSPCVGSGVPA
jgi:hypothetical protein